jgi:hypothetical protein
VNLHQPLPDKGSTSFIPFSSEKDLSALLGFSGDRMRIVVSSRV